MENSPFSWFSWTLPRFLLLLGFLAMEMAASCVLGLGSMGPMAASYGENGPTLCGIKPASSNSPGSGISSSSSASGSSASHFAECYGDDAAIVYGAPLRMAFRGLSAGAGFVCGIQALSSQPYCWGNSFYVQMGVPQSLPANVKYSEISAGDHHFCALRSSSLIVDCWGYNMTGSFRFDSPLRSITAGSIFNCAIVVHNGSAACWGDDTASGVISTLPKHERFRALDAGGYYVCGISVFSGRTVCWGKSMPAGPKQKLSFIAGGRFQACGILTQDRRVFCWGLAPPGNPTNPPADATFSAVVAGDYFTCGLLEHSWKTVCWGGNCPRNSPLAVVPGICSDRACGTGSYADWKLCQKPLQMCLPCSDGACPEGMTEIVPCSARSDRQCGYDCRNCNAGSQCEQHCSRRKKKFFSLKGLLIVAALSCFIICLSLVVFLIAFCMRLKSFKPKQAAVKTHRRSSRPPPKICRAQVFSYAELERATVGFCKEAEVGRGSYSCVFKGELGDGRVVAVKRAVVAGNMKRDSKEFHREVDLLSRLNHAHLLNLLGYCEEGGERLLVYEFMAHGSLHEHLHGTGKEKLDWIRRVTIAVQAARGLEYLHGYACPPVIHRDIKSSNILIDEEHNARVADFGLSLLGPVDSDNPLSELPAGTLGYLDPEYYRLHYLTTKSDVYSFGVLLLEILSGRKAIDMRYEPGNIVEWAVPLIRGKDIQQILDSSLGPPPNQEALFRIARVACRCVRMRGKERPSMDKVTTSLERALALLMGTPCDEQPILPTEVVLGSSRLHNKSSGSHDLELRAPSWITFPSVASSQRRKSSASEEPNTNREAKFCGNQDVKDGSEIRPASPQRELYLQNNF